MSRQERLEEIVKEIKTTHDDLHASAALCASGKYGAKAAGVRSRRLARNLGALLRTWRKESIFTMKEDGTDE